MSFEVAPAHAVAVLGPNGAGKTTLLRILAGILRPTDGEVLVEGGISPVLGLGAGFHRELTGIENVEFFGALHGMRRRDARALVPSIAAFADLEDSIDARLIHYSTGMRARLAFSAAIHLPGSVVLMDEILSVGDAEFRRKCVDRIAELRRDGRTFVIATHSLEGLEEVCPSALVLVDGRLAFDGPTAEAIRFRRSSSATYEATARSGEGRESIGRLGVEHDALSLTRPDL